jgi:hypothetical protein
MRPYGGLIGSNPVTGGLLTVKNAPDSLIQLG